jgi:hypothetical protein
METLSIERWIIFDRGLMSKIQTTHSPISANISRTFRQAYAEKNQWLSNDDDVLLDFCVVQTRR